MTSQACSAGTFSARAPITTTSSASQSRVAVGRRHDRRGRPGPTALVLIVAVWAIAADFQSGEPAGARALYILSALVKVAFGVVLCARPGLGAVTLALLFGLVNLIAGARMPVQGIELRRTGNTLHLAARAKTPA
jgi:hypothetical protein